MEEIKEVAYKYAIKNAYEHDGKSQAGAVVGKVKTLFPESNLKEVAPIIATIVAQVNKMHKDMLNAEYSKFNAIGWELKQVEKEKTLPELDWFKTGMKLITRMAPNPNGVMHFGHARPSVLGDEYVKKYGGKYILRFDDTDPKVKVPVAGIEKEFIADYAWLGIKFDEVCSASDKLERYYEIIEELIKMGKAYVCFCESEKWRELIWDKKACPCREKDAKAQMIEWKKMLKHEIKEEEAVVRIKSDLNAPDPSERDWWMAKVVDEVNHPNPRAKNNHVWPSYNLASAVDDHDMNINFIIRGQEHVSNEEKQKKLYEYFNWNYPHTIYHGKISKLGDMTLSKSKMKLIMDELGVERYDDPRMATIMAFRRRGILPQTIRKIILACGTSISEVKITVEMIAAFNKQFLGEVNSYPFFESAVEMEIYNLVSGEADLYGEKIIFDEGIAKVFVDKKELLKYKDKKENMVRFKKAFNAKITEASEFGAKAMFVSYAKTENPVISWVNELVDIEVLMSDGTIKRGFSSTSLLNAKGVIHLDGLGYVNIESKENGIVKCVFSYL
ncbi:MAG: glutamate--tRNA ligase family protein [archaeon]|jgi:glutamyl-tRNA synthetase